MGNASNVEASRRFIEFATSAAAQRVVAADGLVPALQQVYNDLHSQVPHLKRVRIALEKAVPRPVHRQYRDFAAMVRKHVQPFLEQADGSLTTTFTDGIKATLDPNER